MIERGVLVGKGPELTVRDLGIEGEYKTDTVDHTKDEMMFPSLTETGIDLISAQESLEKYYIKEALRLADGNESKAAKLLNINHHTFRYRKKKLLSG